MLGRGAPAQSEGDDIAAASIFFDADARARPKGGTASVSPFDRARPN